MIPEINLPINQKLYFASDFHLGYPDYDTSLQRERKIIRWLESVQDTAAHIFLMGDLFEFWFEYRHVVPKGYVRLLGKIAELTDGAPIERETLTVLGRELAVPRVAGDVAWFRFEELCSRPLAAAEPVAAAGERHRVARPFGSRRPRWTWRA